MKRISPAVLLLGSSALALAPFGGMHGAAQQQLTSPFFWEEEAHAFSQNPDGTTEDLIEYIERMYQDSQGRRRTETYRVETIADAKALRLIHAYIASRRNLFSLDPDTHTAHDFLNEVVTGADVSASITKTPATEEPIRELSGESLGTDVIFGVPVAGHRTRAAYPKYEQDDGKPAEEIVTDYWYSEELQLTMRLEISDTKHGNFLKQTTKFARGEQDPSLFELPPDYKVDNAR